MTRTNPQSQNLNPAVIAAWGVSRKLRQLADEAISDANKAKLTALRTPQVTLARQIMDESEESMSATAATTCQAVLEAFLGVPIRTDRDGKPNGTIATAQNDVKLSRPDLFTVANRTQALVGLRVAGECLVEAGDILYPKTDEAHNRVRTP